MQRLIRKLKIPQKIVTYVLIDLDKIFSYSIGIIKLECFMTKCRLGGKYRTIFMFNNSFMHAKSNKNNMQ